jgi:hypothetical protein
MLRSRRSKRRRCLRRNSFAPPTMRVSRQ